MNALRQVTRFIIALMLNILIAIFAPVFIEYAYVHYLPVASIRDKLLATLVLTALVAGGIGFTVYRKWRPSASLWMWLVGLCWFGQGALLDGGQGTMWGFTDSVFLDIPSINKWALYTVTSVRIVSYSIGSLVGRWLQPMDVRLPLGIK